MSTLGDIVNDLTTEYLKRDDIRVATEKLCVKAYRSICAKVPFEGLMQTSAERTVDTASTTHDLSDIVDSLAGISWIRLTDDNGNRRILARKSVKFLDGLNSTTSGGNGPSIWGRWGRNIEFDRVAPSSGYTVRLRYWERPQIEAVVSDTELDFPEEWEELLFWETAYRVHMMLKEGDVAAQLVAPMPMPRQPSPVKTRIFEYGIIPRLWNDLLKTVEDREMLGSSEAFYPTVGGR